jgi:hypothetical protein
VTDQPDEPYWMTRAGERIAVRDMTTEHIENVLRMFRTWKPEKVKHRHPTVGIMIKELARRKGPAPPITAPRWPPPRDMIMDEKDEP